MYGPMNRIPIPPSTRCRYGIVQAALVMVCLPLSGCVDSSSQSRREGSIVSSSNLRVYAFGASSDGKYAASGGAETIISTWDVASAKSRTFPHGHKQAVLCLSRSAEGLQLRVVCR